ncbi:MAG: T9SS type A sorting domain-containing protein [Saprospiraceae bacterium]|nr:T9SS type A sorting domain-containing protein [Saprospiraceae bacterium]
MKLAVIILFVLLIKGLSAQEYTLNYNNLGYNELKDEFVLCKDSIPRHKYFLLEHPIILFNEEIDSVFILDWNVIHIGLGNRKSREFDLFTPLNCPIKKFSDSDDSVGFTIGYKTFGEPSKQTLVIQWKGIRPKINYSQNDDINLQIIVNEEKNTLTYSYGKLLPFFELILSVWTNNRQLSLYFVDDIKSFNDIKFDVKYIAKDVLPPHNFVINTAYFTGSAFNDYYVSSKTPYDHDGIEITEGLNFIIGEDIKSNNQELNNINTPLYPNPASYELHIKSEESMKPNYEIYNTSGKLLQSGNIQNNTINIEEISPGLHLLKWVTERGNVHIGKFVKL